MPFDFWFRKKYKIPFGSKEHKKCNFINQVLDYIEDNMIRSHINQKDKDEYSDLEDENIIHLDQEQIEEDFEDLNFEDYE